MAKRKVTKNEEEDLGEIFNKNIQDYWDQLSDFLVSIEADEKISKYNIGDWSVVFQDLKES